MRMGLRRGIRILAGIVLLLTVLLYAFLLYLRLSGPVFSEGSVLSTPQDGDMRLLVLNVNLKNPGPIPVEWIGISSEPEPDESILWADDGSLVLNAFEEGTLKMAILSSESNWDRKREVTVSGYRFGKRSEIRLVADGNGIRLKGEE